MKDYYYEPICYELAKSLHPEADVRDTHYLINDTSEMVLVIVEHESGERHTVRLDTLRTKEATPVLYNELYTNTKHRDIATPVCIGLIVITLVLSIILFQFI